MQGTATVLATHQADLDIGDIRLAEIIAVKAGGMDHPIPDIQADFNGASRGAGDPAKVVLGRAAEIPFPATIFLLGQVLDGGPVISGQMARFAGMGLSDVRGQIVHERFDIHGANQMLADIGHPAADGLNRLVRVFGRIHEQHGGQHLQVHVKEQRAVMQDPLFMNMLGVAGDFQALNDKIVAAVEFGRYGRVLR